MASSFERNGCIGNKNEFQRFATLLQWTFYSLRNKDGPPRRDSFCPEHSNKGVGITLYNARRDSNDIIQSPLVNPSPLTSEKDAKQALSTMSLKSFKQQKKYEPDYPDFYLQQARVSQLSHGVITRESSNSLPKHHSAISLFGIVWSSCGFA